MSEKKIGKYILIVGVILILIRSREIINAEMDLNDYIGLGLGVIHVVYGVYLVKQNKTN